MLFLTGDEESSAHLMEAMKDGYVNVSLVKVIVEGSAGVGKTCLLHLLLKRPPPQKRHSTGVAERAIRVIRVWKESGEWNEISTEEFQKMIAEIVPVLYQELRDKKQGEEEENENEGEVAIREWEEGEVSGVVLGGMSMVRDDETSVVTVGETSVVQEVGKGEEIQKRESKHTVNLKDGKAVMEDVLRKLTQMVGSGKTSRRLLDMELMYLTDTGGQQPFWDLIPIFTRATSATIFVHRLCEELDEHPLNDLYQRGQQVGPSRRATLTTAQAFKTMLRGMHEGGRHSKIITVGTHRDLAEDCKETLMEKNKKLVAISSSNFKRDVVYRNEGLKEVVFPVNTTAPEEVDRKEGEKIRASIEKEATQHEIPIWWFILQMILEDLARKLGRDVLSKEECLRISDSLGFSEAELNSALSFFDRLNIFFFKETVLPTAVFTNPQVPLDKLSKLVEKQYHLKAAEADPSKAADLAMTGDWQSFRDQGVLTLQMLQEFESHYLEEVFTARHFLLLLEKLLVIAPLSSAKTLSTTEYFFPAVLSTMPESRVSGFLSSRKPGDIAALAVEFPTGWAPPGVFCCSVCHLQSHSHWEVVHRPHPTSDGSPDSLLTQVFRNCITFTKRGRPGSVTFIDNLAFFVVCVNVGTSKLDRDELVELCQLVRWEHFAAVKAGLEKTHHSDSNPELSILCPCQSQFCSSELHTAQISDNRRKWICSKDRDVFDCLSPEQNLWLSGPGEPHTHSHMQEHTQSSLMMKASDDVCHTHGNQQKLSLFWLGCPHKPHMHGSPCTELFGVCLCLALYCVVDLEPCLLSCPGSSVGRALCLGSGPTRGSSFFFEKCVGLGVVDMHLLCSYTP